MGSHQASPQGVILIGLGQRGLHTALPRIRASPYFELIAVCDPDREALQRVQNSDSKVLSFACVDQVVLNHLHKAIRITCAYISVPHSQYVAILPVLLRAGIHVLKEKPAAITSSELRMYHALADHHKIRLVTASDSRYGSRWSQTNDWLPLIGDMQVIEGTRKIMVPDLTQGWRAKKQLAGGGAVNDIGWHLIDIILGIVGSDCEISVPYSKLYRTQSS